jgi:hypothetical protein
MRWGWSGIGHCSWPLATLTLFSTGVELGPTVRGLRLLVPVWRARLDEISVVEVFQTRFRLASGVRFTPTSGSPVYFGIPYWVLSLADIVSALEGNGLRVDRSPQRLRLFGWP